MLAPNDTVGGTTPRNSTSVTTPPPHSHPPGIAVNTILICVLVIYGLSMLFVVTVWLTRKHKRYKIDTRVSVLVRGTTDGTRRVKKRRRERSRATVGKRPRLHYTRHFIGKRGREISPLELECDRQPPRSVDVLGDRARDHSVWFVGSGFNRKLGGADECAGAVIGLATGEGCALPSPAPPPRRSADEKHVHFCEQVCAEQYSISVYSCTELSGSEPDLSECVRGTHTSIDSDIDCLTRIEVTWWMHGRIITWYYGVIRP